MFGRNKKTVAVKELTTRQIVEEIHETFYTEVDRLLAESKILKSTESQMQGLIDKANKLKALGFENTKECKDAQAEVERLRKIGEENKGKEQVRRMIEYFSQKYPTYKFITEDSVKKICAKYGLVYGEASRYKGTVPDKNLAEIENFKIDSGDDCWAFWVNRSYYNADYSNRTTKRIVEKYESGAQKAINAEYERNHNLQLYSDPSPTKDQWMKYIVDLQERKQQYYLSESPLDGVALRRPSINGMGQLTKLSNQRDQSTFCPLEIAAPKSDFDMTGLETEGGKLVNKAVEIPDPVVLKPVCFNGVKAFLVISAWGLEASDELVVNQKMN